MEKNDNKFMCLEQEDGPTMILYYDNTNKELRDLLRESPFNICSACVIEEHWKTNKPLSQIVKEFENKIRIQNKIQDIKDGLKVVEVKY